jgi:tetratricopeptide (TPR) repeat protein
MVRRLIWPLLCVALAGPTALSQGDELSALLRMNEASKTVPVWTPVPAGETQDLSAVVERMHPAIFFVGKESVGHGTAFLISKEHRLLATNAHVADIFYEGTDDMVAISNGTSKVYEVEKAYYHPGVCRVAGDRVMRTTDPQIGGVYPMSPDVAILKLKAGEELPEAIPLAGPQEIVRLLAKSVAMMGYPAYDNKEWPGLGEKVEATFRDGSVCRVTDFTNDVNAPDNRLQFIQHSLNSFGGFSGSPIFLRDGHVVALNNSGGMEKDRGRIAVLSYGVRVDCLWECLKQYDMLDMVPVAADRESIDVERFKRPDPSLATLSEVRRLVAIARIDIANHEESAAIEKCNQAFELMPNYEPIFDVRCIAYTSYAINKLGDRSEEAHKFYDYALDAAAKASELAPSSHDHVLDLAVAAMNLNNSRQPPGVYKENPDALKLAEEVLSLRHVRDRDRAYAYRTRALARGMPREAIADLEKAVDIDPWIPASYATLRMYWNIYGDAAAAQKAFEKYQQVSAAQAEADQAWLAATSRDEDHRNGHDALRLATKACEATDFKWWQPLRSLAAAHAELGDFDKAVSFAHTAIELAPADELPAVRRQLASYQQREPWREN